MPWRGCSRAPRAAAPVVLIALALAPRPAQAERLPLTPPGTSVAYTVYVLGLIPIHAYFQRFQGSVVLDPSQPAACQVDVTVQVASLKMNDPDRQRQALSAAMLDADRYPTIHFAGACAAHGLVGTLTLHGVSHTITFDLLRGGNQFVCTGVVRRGDYGIVGLPGLVGQHVSLRLTMQRPTGPKQQ